MASRALRHACMRSTHVSHASSCILVHPRGAGGLHGPLIGHVRFSSFASWLTRNAMQTALDRITKPVTSAPSSPSPALDDGAASFALSQAHAAVAAVQRHHDADDADVWRALLSTPVVPSADEVASDDLCVSANVDALDLNRFPGAHELDPFATVAADLNSINGSIKALLGVDHPVLSTVATYFFNSGGKKIRPAMAVLMASAVNAHVAARPPDRAGYLPLHVVAPLQRRLAEISELIHTASLLHDDVIDGAETRRGVPALNTAFGNKLAVLGGDFLLARASVCLARLRNIAVVDALSTVIEHLVKGEVMQMKHVFANEEALRGAVETYLRKTYYKTGSLMANSCRAVAMLGWYPQPVCDAAFKYGMHTGVAFQLIDDLLDYEGTSVAMGKPVQADLKAGLATAPVLFAAQRFPTLLPLIQRKFASPGDVEAVLQFVAAADGITATRRLAIAHGQHALKALETLVDSPARTALAALVSAVLSRNR